MGVMQSPFRTILYVTLAMLVTIPGNPSAGDDSRAPAYLGPCAVAVTDDARTLFVACADAGKLLWVDVPSGNVTRAVAVAGRPTAVVLSPDRSRLLLTCAAPRSTLAVLDAATGKVLKTIDTGHTSTAVAVHPDGRQAYVCNRFDGDVSVLDLVTGSTLQRVPVQREPIAVAVTRDGAAAVVANHLPHMRTDVALLEEVSPVVTVIDTTTYEATDVVLPNGSNGLRGMCVTPDGQYALVTHLLSNFQMVPSRLETGWINTNVISILDLMTCTVLATIGLDHMDRGAGNPWDVVCTADGQTVCVSCSGTHELATIPFATLFSRDARTTMSPMMAVWPIYPNLGASLWRRAALPGKGPRGLVTAGNQVFAAEYFSDTVSVLELAAGETPAARTIALGPTPSPTLERQGELLFHDATICYQHWQSCASCHPDGRVDALNWDLLNDGIGNPKNTKSMLLAHQTPPAMAVGVRATAEAAVRSGLDHILFAPRPEAEAAAIDAYLQSLTAVPSPRLVDGKLSAAALRGKELFHDPRMACHRCHPAPLYTDLKPHDVGTRAPLDRHDHFDTPTLIEVWRTAPYLHDGRYLTVRQVLAEGRHGLRGDVELSAQEIDDLVEFVLSL
jgi:YVTN family beta-propeller protein